MIALGAVALGVFNLYLTAFPAPFSGFGQVEDVVERRRAERQPLRAGDRRRAAAGDGARAAARQADGVGGRAGGVRHLGAGTSAETRGPVGDDRQRFACGGAAGGAAAVPGAQRPAESVARGVVPRVGARRGVRVQHDGPVPDGPPVPAPGELHHGAGGQLPPAVHRPGDGRHAEDASRRVVSRFGAGGVPRGDGAGRDADAGAGDPAGERRPRRARSRAVAAGAVRAVFDRVFRAAAGQGVLLLGRRRRGAGVQGRREHGGGAGRPDRRRVAVRRTDPRVPGALRAGRVGARVPPGDAAAPGAVREARAEGAEDRRGGRGATWRRSRFRETRRSTCARR